MRCVIFISTRFHRVCVHLLLEFGGKKTNNNCTDSYRIEKEKKKKKQWKNKTVFALKKKKQKASKNYKRTTSGRRQLQASLHIHTNWNKFKRNDEISDEKHQQQHRRAQYRILLCENVRTLVRMRSECCGYDYETYAMHSVVHASNRDNPIDRMLYTANLLRAA